VERTAGIEPCAGSPFEHNQVSSAGCQQCAGEVRTGSSLADQNHRCVGLQIGSAQLNLLQRNIDGSGQVRGGEFSCRAHIHKLRAAAFRLPILPGFYIDNPLRGYWHFYPL
jgi:hypothetical protein